MSKTKNIVAAGLAILGNTVGGNVLGNNNQLSNQQNNTKMVLVDALANPQQDESTFQVDLSRSPLDQIPQKKYEGIYAGFDKDPESLNWEKIYEESLSDIPVEVLKYGLLRKMNEIRKEHGLNPLKYDKKLEQVAQDYADDLNGTSWWEPGHLLHVDSQGRDHYDRVRDAGLLGKYLEKSDESVRENMSTISGYTINSLFNAFMRSHFHKKAIISNELNSVGFGYSKSGNAIIQLFGQVKKGG